MINCYPYYILKNHLDPFIKNKANLFEGGFDTKFIQTLILDTLFSDFKYYGVNTCKATDINFEIPYSDRMTIYEKYVHYCEAEGIRPLFEKEFKNKYLLKLETNIEDFILSTNLNRKYDVGIFNNLFHSLEANSALDIVKWFKNSSTSNALLVIGVNISPECDVPNIRVCDKEEINDWINSFGMKINECEYGNFYKQFLIKKSS